jgi:hypothetical protein
MCNWVHLPNKENALPSTCKNEGEPYCPEHQAEMDYIHTLDEDWKEIEATHKAVCDEPRGRTTKTHLSPKP